MIRRLLLTLAALLPVLLAATPAEARWLEARTAKFIIAGGIAEKPLRDFAVTLEDYDSLLRLLTGTDAPPPAAPLHIYMAGSAGDLRIIQHIPSGVLGFYTATGNGVAAFVSRGSGYGVDGITILLHEYAHHFMMQYHAAAYPRWYVEGFAEYMMTAKFTDKTIEFGGINPGRAMSLTRGSWLPFKQIFEDRKKLSTDDQAMFYAESWLIVHYLFRNPERTPQLRKFLEQTNKGIAQEAAFKDAFGTDYAGFQHIVESYAHGRLTFSRITRQSERAKVDVTINALPASADALMFPSGALRVGVADDLRAPLLERIRAAAARFPGDGFAQRTLAGAEAMYGEPAKAIALIDTLAAATPGAKAQADAGLSRLKGLALLRDARKLEGEARQERFTVARHAFAAAHAADPNDFTTLYRYAECEAMLKGKLDDNDLNILLLAHGLAPQVAIVSFTTAAVAANHGYYDEAADLLAPLAADPHDDQGADLARETIARVRRHERVPVMFAAPEKADE